jgi:hypothetical protein
MAQFGITTAYLDCRQVADATYPYGTKIRAKSINFELSPKNLVQ